jgi:hypothetical protein
MLAYCLNKNLDSQKLLQDIQNLVNKHNQDPNNQLILTIRVVKINQETVEHIPKLEYKQP